ncbi:oligosaccharide flippase family protein [Pendulispora brunnea]|uniref:Oligosaccharide flippase family protein n=1 Tax=Pendulispora brunnea TaxID=2905690 RepID=A0ABZ2K6N0_9BACT
MSRRANALIAAVFSYGQTALAVLVGFAVTRVVVGTLGADLYGLWLATGALLGYATLADLGTFAVMPWLFAEADSQKDSARMRSLVLHGLLAGVVSGAMYVVLALVLWLAFPALLHLSAADRATLAGPLLVMVLGVAISYPLRLFSTLCQGQQDFKYMGPFQLLQILASGLLTYALVRLGAGLYAVGVAAAVPPFISGIAAAHRALTRNRHLFRGWPRPSWREVKPILTSGTGTWLGALGWQLAFATDSVVLASVGLRGDISSFSVTSRICFALMQLGWVIPDSASVGLAQMHAEGNATRTAHVVRSIVRVTLFLAGGVVCVTLSINAAFVSLWVGPELFGGARLNGVFGLDIVILSVVHALLTTAAVLGYRMRVGMITLVNGALHIGLALLLGRWFGTSGVAAATAISALATSIPVGLHLLRQAIPLRSLVADLGVWLLRLVPCTLMAALFGWISVQPHLTRLMPPGRFGALAVGAAGAAISGTAYVLAMRPMLRDLPLGDRIRRWCRLPVPPAPA